MTPAREPEDAHAPDPAGSAELRALYRSLRPPPLVDEASGADPETARVVAWMRGAWNTLPIPPASVPRPAWRPRSLALAVAAVLLALTGAALWRDHGARGPSEAPRRVVCGPEPRHGPALPAPSVAPGTVEVLSAQRDQLELRSGPVRLVLLAPPSETPGIPPGS